MILNDDPIVRCSRCGKDNKIPQNWFGGDSYSIGEFGMGARIQHDFYCEVECNNCGNQMSIMIHGYEYPIGGFDGQDSEAEGCEVISEPTIEMDCIPEPVLTLYEQILNNPQSVYDIEPWEFEELVADVFRKNGFHAEVTQKTRDGGKDIVATFDMGGVLYRTYFECKQQSISRPVGVDIVRNLYAVMERDRVDKGVIVTTSRFTRDAIREAEMLNCRIQLVDFQKLQRLMK
ncbi:MAG: restriction endonuclease [Clostridia bacterium]